MYKLIDCFAYANYIIIKVANYHDSVIVDLVVARKPSHDHELVLFKLMLKEWWKFNLVKKISTQFFDVYS